VNLQLIIPTADSIQKILNLNQDPAQSDNGHSDPTANNGLTPSSVPILNSDGEAIWKVLVFDDLGRDVISSVLRVNDLRTWGVTMHMYVKRTISGFDFHRKKIAECG
jgi:sec1 family domain-containing protein 1